MEYTKEFEVFTNFIIDVLEDPEGLGCWQHQGEDWETCYGIAHRWHPDLTFPISRTKAIELYHQRYWIPSGAQEMADDGRPQLALIHYDAYVNQGGRIANSILSVVSGHQEYLLERLNEYHGIRDRQTADGRPNMEAFSRWKLNIHGWSARLARVARAWRQLDLEGLDDPKVDRFFLCDAHGCVELPFHKARVVNGKLYVRTVKSEEEIRAEQVAQEIAAMNEAPPPLRINTPLELV